MISSKGRRLSRACWFWSRFWMRFAGYGFWGRTAMRIASWLAPRYKARVYLARLSPKGYLAPGAVVAHKDLQLGANVFMDEGAVIYQFHEDAGPVTVGDRVCLHRDVLIEVGSGGSLDIGANTHIQARCIFAAFAAPIRIGNNVQIAPYCTLYPYDHCTAPDKLIIEQPLKTKGGIIIEDDVWLGVGVTVLDGVRIGNGAVIGAKSLVTHDVPEGAIAVGMPARVIGYRADHAEQADA